MIQITIGLPDFPEMRRTINIAREFISDLDGIWREVVHPWILEHMGEQFDTAGAHGGERWSVYENEPKYKAHKLAIVGHLRPLVWDWGGEYERLRPSLMEKDHPLQIFETDDWSMRFGTSVEYAESLNAGGTGPFGEPFPGRRIFGMTEGQKKELATVIQRAIMQDIPPELRKFMRR